jgi:glycosyltransferase involved in cell wall biosynthesis
MPKILILTSGHICCMPRPQKEAETLANAGYDVTVYGIWFDPELAERDRLLMNNKKWRFEPVVDLQPHKKLQNWSTRFQTRLAREKYLRFGIFSPELLSYGAKKMLASAYKAHADLTIVHVELGLWVGNELLNNGFRVGVDFEDWFSEDLLPEARAARPIAQLKLLESRLVRECSYCLTTSHALAEALAKTYQAPEPTVIYNTFPFAERLLIDNQIRDRRNLNLPSVHWFSQTIGPGRGLETLFQCLPYLKIPLEIHLRGNYPERYHQRLEPLIPDEWRDRLFIHSTVPNAELISRIAEHDIGLALETPYCLNREFTITNKLFQYLQAGLAVIATDTIGQREILLQKPEIGHLIPNNNPIALAQSIEKLLQIPSELISAKKAALQAAKEKFSWENDAKKIVQLAENCI